MEDKKEIITVETLKEPMALGEVFFQSGMFPDVKSQAMAVVKILAGREIGLSPMESMNSLYMVNNHIAVTVKIIAAKIRMSKVYDYRIEKLDDKECVLVFLRYKQDGQEEILGKSTFSTADAAKAGIVNKDNWKNYPKNMVFARAMSNGSRWYCPEVMTGFYSAEELEDITPMKIEDTITITDGKVEKNGEKA
jgi:hypothetical protein